jgi:hypothetical protein
VNIQQASNDYNYCEKNLFALVKKPTISDAKSNTNIMFKAHSFVTRSILHEFVFGSCSVRVLASSADSAFDKESHLRLLIVSNMLCCINTQTLCHWPNNVYKTGGACK